MTPNQTIPQALKALRASLGMTQQQFAEHVGVEPTTIGGFESKRKPGKALLKRLSELAEERGLNDESATLRAAATRRKSREQSMATSA